MRKNGDDGVHISTPRSRSKADDTFSSVADDALYSVAFTFIIFLPSPAQY